MNVSVNDYILTAETNNKDYKKPNRLLQLPAEFIKFILLSFLSPISSTTHILFMQTKSKVITPQSLGFPSKIGDFLIQPVSWNSFPAPAPENTWFLAYTYWTSNYKYQFTTRNGKQTKFRVTFTTSISPKSWHKRGLQDDDLLQHEYGHYLINCIMGLDFRLNANTYGRTCPSQQQFKTYCQNLFNQKRKQYSLKQKQYDKDSYHYLDREGQLKWQNLMKEQILKYAQKQKQYEQQQKKINQKQLTIPNTLKQKTEQKVRKNIQQPQISIQNKVQRKEYSIRKVQKQIGKNPSVPKPNPKPLNNVRAIADLYRKQQLY